MELSEMTGSDGRGAESAFLVIQRGDARLEVVELTPGGRFTIGRAHTNRIVLPDAKCSRLHCEIFSRAGEWKLRDLGSRNGVTVNGKRLEADESLDYGDSIGVGSCTMLFTDRPRDGSQDIPKSDPSIDVESGYEIIERKSGTQYDIQHGMERVNKNRDDAAALFRLARSISSSTSESELCHNVLESLAIRTGASFGGIIITPAGDPDPDIERMAPIAVYGQPPATGFSTFLTRIALDDQDAILAHDISKNASLASQQSLQALNAESAICAPIRHHKKSLGVIHLYSTNSTAPMTQSSLEFVLAVADHMGDQMSALRERLELEVGLDRARQIVVDLQDQLEVGSELVGNSSKLEELRRSIARVAPTDALVLIRGESGVGKELVARAVHFNSLRKNGPFVCVNCAALTESLLESELFGHEKGAFTGASSKRSGKFEQAHGGTLFLDEIGEMSPEIQAKFLRVLEGQAFERVGGGEPIMVDVRVVTATNRNLEEAVRERRFRRDLFFRLQVIELEVLPLRHHPGDIPAIAQHFVERFAAQAHRRVRGFSTAAIQKLQRHDWPGNVRELRNVVERAVILSDHEILGPDDIVLTRLRLDDDESSTTTSPSIPTSIAASAESPLETSVDPSIDLWGSFIQRSTTLDDMDRLYIEAVLKSTDWNKSKASRILQIERTTLDRRLKKYGIGRPGGLPDDEGDEDDSVNETVFTQ
ncbi:sigma 54-interacting transcriptional regulator [Planctomicrobium sp. SH668]|uniref:sigma 54-interacting transcriptional regulator n=1 Tax=Planctomicrobium sp. SH668 TaxID=3448126 RepID=UPI003F5BD603